jgi:ABC-2 type transport system permease protein
VRKALAFVRRDFLIHSSYRLAFVLQLISGVLTVTSYYLLSQYIGKSLELSGHGDAYFAFVLVGLTLQDYSSISLRTFSTNIRESQLAGNLEALLSTQTPMHEVILSSALYPFLWTSVNVILYIALGRVLFGVSLASVNWIGAIVILLLTVFVSSGIGILSASFVLVFKRGDPLGWFLESVSFLLAGVLYPTTVLPAWLNRISVWLPLRYSIEGMRRAVLDRGSLAEIWPSILPLLLFACAILPFSLGAFSLANRWVRMSGSMNEY